MGYYDNESEYFREYDREEEARRAEMDRYEEERKLEDYRSWEYYERHKSAYTTSSSVGNVDEDERSYVYYDSGGISFNFLFSRSSLNLISIYIGFCFALFIVDTASIAKSLIGVLIALYCIFIAKLNYKGMFLKIIYSAFTLFGKVFAAIALLINGLNLEQLVLRYIFSLFR